MKFLLGPPPNSLNDVQIASGNWKPIARVPMWALQMAAPIIGGAFALCLFVAWIILCPRFEISFAPSHQVVGVVIAVFLSGLMIQLVSHPSLGLSASSVVGFWPSRITFYTAYLDGLSKWRCMLKLVSPLILMSVLPIAAASTLRLASGWLLFVSCSAAFLFGVNILFALWM